MALITGQVVHCYWVDQKGLTTIYLKGDYCPIQFKGKYGALVGALLRPGDEIRAEYQEKVTVYGKGTEFEFQSESRIGQRLEFTNPQPHDKNDRIERASEKARFLWDSYQAVKRSGLFEIEDAEDEEAS